MFFREARDKEHVLMWLCIFPEWSHAKEPRPPCVALQSLCSSCCVCVCVRDLTHVVVSAWGKEQGHSSRPPLRQWQTSLKSSFLNGRQTTGHYHTDAASVQMWVLMKVHWVGNTINSLRAASGIMMGLSGPTQSRFPRNYCHIKWICRARFAFIGQFAGRFGLGNRQWTRHLCCRTVSFFSVAWQGNMSFYRLLCETGPSCLSGGSI